MKRSVLVAAFVILIPLAFAGCGDGFPPRGPVAGTVTYQGDPVPNANVAFIAEGAPRHSLGKTDADGKFTLTTVSPGDGAFLGENVVTVDVPAEAGGATYSEVPTADEYEAALAASAAAERQKPPIPLKYADPANSDLRVVVDADGTIANLELTDD